MLRASCTVKDATQVGERGLARHCSLAPVATLLGQEPTRRTRKIDEANLHNDKNMHTDT